jgi:hypothetical protein
MNGKCPMNTRTWVKLMALGFVAYGVYSLWPDVKRYIRISTM